MTTFGEAETVVEKIANSSTLQSEFARAVAFDFFMHVACAPALGPQPFHPDPHITIECMDEVVRFFQQEVGWEVRCEANDGRPMVRFNSESPRLRQPVTVH